MSDTLRILLLDDNPHDRALVIRELRREFPALQAEQIIEAQGLTQALEAGDFDLVITDYHLGWTDGLTILHAIKSRYATCPVIMFTGTGSEEIAVEALKAGLDDYVIKSPEHYARLPAVVQSVLEGARQRQALQEAETRYHGLFEGVPVGLYRTTPEGQFLDANHALVQMLGYPDREALLAVNAADLYVNAEDRQRWQAIIKREAAAYSLKVQLQRRDGTVIWVTDKGRALYDTDGRALYYEGSLEEITERVQAEDALRQRNRELALLNRASQALSSTLDLDQVLITVLEVVRRLLDVVACSVWLTDLATDELVCRQATGPQSEIVRGWRLAPGDGLAGWVAQSGESLIVPDIQADARHFKGVDQQTGLALRSVLSVPLRAKGGVVGVLQVVDAEADRFKPTDLTLVEPLAASAAIALENARLYQEAEGLRAFNENIVQSMEQGILLYDATGHITFVNPKTAELLGYTPEALKGRHWLTIVAPEHVAQAEAATIKQPQGIAGRYETALLTREGQRIPVIVSSRPLFDEIPDQGIAGRFSGVLTVFTDITERKRAEEEIRRHNQELIALNAIATTIGQSLDLDHILNATLDKLLEMIEVEAGWIQLLDEDENGDWLSLAAQRGLSQGLVQETKKTKLGQGLTGKVAQSGEPIVVANVLDDPQFSLESRGREAPHAFAGVPIQAKDKVLGVLGVLSPRELNPREVQLVTAIGHQIGVAVDNVRLVEEASEIEVLRELDRLRAELIANVSHELRTPLGLIKIFCTTLLREDIDLDHEIRREFLRDIEDETEKLETIVDNLLDLSRMKDGRLRLDKHPTDVSQLAEQVMAALDVQVTQHRFVHDFPTAPLVAMIDPKRIEQVLRNLLSNAIKYSPAGGTITVQGRGDKKQLLIQVSDTGIGIPAEDLERVFERFYRVENEITQTARGAGLGLAVCQGIVEAHGGRIWVESAPGVGSTFFFTLPTGTRSDG